MTAKLYRLFDHRSVRGEAVVPPSVLVATQRAEKRRLFMAAIDLARARNALGACGQCEREITKRSLVYHVPEYKLFFCVRCGVVWRDEIYPMLSKGRNR